jgi:hypothetical protein
MSISLPGPYTFMSTKAYVLSLAKIMHTVLLGVKKEECTWQKKVRFSHVFSPDDL